MRDESARGLHRPALIEDGAVSVLMAEEGGELRGFSACGDSRDDDAATVWSFAANERANAFYETHGFTLDRAEKTEEAWAGLPEVRYRRSL